MPISFRSLPELPPESATVTTAETFTNLSLSPSKIVETPVPPPMITIRFLRSSLRRSNTIFIISLRFFSGISAEEIEFTSSLRPRTTSEIAKNNTIKPIIIITEFPKGIFLAIEIRNIFLKKAVLEPVENLKYTTATEYSNNNMPIKIDNRYLLILMPGRSHRKKGCLINFIYLYPCVES